MDHGWDTPRSHQNSPKNYFLSPRLEQEVGICSGSGSDVINARLGGADAAEIQPEILENPFFLEYPEWEGSQGSWNPNPGFFTLC